MIAESQRGGCHSQSEKESLHKLLSAQLRKAAQHPGVAELAQLLELVDTTYRVRDEELEQCTRAMALLAGKLQQAERERTQFVAALEEQAVRFGIALDNMSQGVCLFDANKRLVLSNRRYAEIYGLSPDQIHPGKTLKEIL